ncbi:MAG: glycosyltransferase family 39 protein [bacterium]|nr:glycosyltransferase family 39 protein [bacterium]
MTNFRKYLLISLIFAAINAILLLVFFVPQFNHPDTLQYVSTIKHISGDEGSEISPFRILKPLPILIAVLLNPILSPENALVAQNVIFYFLSVWLVFLLVCKIYKNEKQALYGTILYGASYPMLAYGLAALTDLSGWFFFLLTVLLSLSFLKNPSFKTAFWPGLVAGFGMLFKESMAAAPLFFAGLVFIASPISLKEKFKYIFIFGSAFIIFPLINSIVLYKLYSYSYWDAFRLGGIDAEGIKGFYMVSPLRIMIEIGRVLLIGWLFVFLGALKEFFSKNIERIKILFSFLPPSLSVFLWSYPHNRILFIAFPVLVLLGSLGLLRNYKNPRLNSLVEIALLSAYVLINYFILEFLLKYGPVIQPPGTLFS